jgi:hypothetical protein
MVPKQLVFTAPSQMATMQFNQAGEEIGMAKLPDTVNPNVPATFTLNGDILVHGVGIKETDTGIKLVTDGSGDVEVEKSLFGGSSSTTVLATITTPIQSPNSDGDMVDLPHQPITIDVDGSSAGEEPTPIVTVAFLKALLSLSPSMTLEELAALL